MPSREGNGTTSRRDRLGTRTTTGDGMATDKAQTWVYSEEYAAEREAVAAAREVAVELGAEPVTTGVLMVSGLS